MTHPTPKTGDVIRFMIVPTASYASVGPEYEVTRQGQTIHLRNRVTGGATSDKAWAYRDASWAAFEGPSAGE